MFFSKKPVDQQSEQKSDKPQRVNYHVRVHLKGRAQRIWYWDFDQVDAKEAAQKFYDGLLEKVNAATDNDYVSLTDDLFVRRDQITEILIKP